MLISQKLFYSLQERQKFSNPAVLCTVIYITLTTRPKYTLIVESLCLLQEILTQFFG